MNRRFEYKEVKVKLQEIEETITKETEDGWRYKDHIDPGSTVIRCIFERPIETTINQSSASTITSIKKVKSNDEVLQKAN